MDMGGGGVGFFFYCWMLNKTHFHWLEKMSAAFTMHPSNLDHKDMQKGWGWGGGGRHWSLTLRDCWFSAGSFNLSLSKAFCLAIVDVHDYICNDLTITAYAKKSEQYYHSFSFLNSYWGTHWFAFISVSGMFYLYHCLPSDCPDNNHKYSMSLGHSTETTLFHFPDYLPHLSFLHFDFDFHMFQPSPPGWKQTCSQVWSASVILSVLLLYRSLNSTYLVWAHWMSAQVQSHTAAFRVAIIIEISKCRQLFSVMQHSLDLRHCLLCWAVLYLYQYL